MVSYVASARIERVTVRGRSREYHCVGSAPEAAAGVGRPVLDPIEPEVKLPSLLADLCERLGSVAEAWAQATYYVTDPRSWR